MKMLSTAVIVAASFVMPRVAVSQPPPLTLEQALATARERAPAIVTARVRIEEARGRLAGASALFRDNPVIESSVGSRRSAGGDSSVDREVSLMQNFELGGRRTARVTGAQADVARATASAADTVRRHLREVAAAFVRTLAADERLRLAQGAERVGEELARVAERRHRAGDLPALDMNVATAAAARARADVHAARAARVGAAGELRAALGMDPTEVLEVAGNLHERRTYHLEELLADLPARPDLQALAAELRHAQAEVALGQGMRWPEVGLGVRHEHEEGADIVLGAVSIALPLFARGQELRATGAARAHRLRIEIDAARRLAESEVRTAFAAYQQHLQAADDLERNALPLLDENESLARRSYEAGEIALAELLVVRREILETRQEHLDRLLDVALAGVEVETRAGVLR